MPQKALRERADVSYPLYSDMDTGRTMERIVRVSSSHDEAVLPALQYCDTPLLE